MYDENPDICFFIADSIPKKGDQDETIRKFKENMEASGITNISHYMTLTQLKRDYNTHNLKQKLCHTYDIFLVESKISDHVYSILGKQFIKKRKRPFQIDTKNDKTMKISIDNALKKSVMKISPKSLISSFEIGVSKMENDKLAENIIDAAEQLAEKWPGGWRNVSRIYLRPMQPSKVSIPIYASTINPNDVEIPTILGAKHKRLSKLELKLKKAGKIELNLNTKQIVKVKKGVVKKDGAVNEKKRKIDQEEQIPKKKKKEEMKGKKVKSEEKQQAGVVAEKLDKKKKKIVEEAQVVEAPTKKKNKKSAEQPAEEEEKNSDVKKKKKKNEAEKEEPANKKKKKAEVDDEPVAEKKKKKKNEPQSAVVDVVKPKNKKKSKSTAVTDAINKSDEKSTDEPAEKDQTAANSSAGKKKKTKKNKA